MAVNGKNLITTIQVNLVPLAHPFFTAWLFGLDITSFCTCIHQSGSFFNLFFFFTTERRKEVIRFLIL